MPTYGLTPAGFVPKPTTAILADFEATELATMDPAIDLSPTAPQGQLNGIVANAMSELWQLLGVAFNSNNRQASEGALLDNIGDEVGIPRETASYTQVAANLTFSSGAIGNTYAAGALVANVAGNTPFTFANLAPLTVTETGMTGVTMQASTIGATVSVNPGTLTVITGPVAGWLSITNPVAQSVLGSNEELDANYAARQEEELAVEGSCNPPATAAAVYALAAAQGPPVPVAVNVLENESEVPESFGGFILPPHTFAVVVYDSIGWSSSDAGEQAIGAAIWQNKPTGISSIGNTEVIINDPILGAQPVYFSLPTPEPLYVTGRIVIRAGFTFASVVANVQAALIAASTAATPAGGTPPNGQLLPGGAVIGSQLESVIMGVAGVLDLQALAFDFVPSPTNTAPLPVSAVSIATMTSANVANLIFTQGTAP